MSNITHASIVPLIGGETIASHNAFGKPPMHFMSYEAFAANDKHIVNHYDNEIPYYVLDEKEVRSHQQMKELMLLHQYVLVLALSMMSHGYGDDNPNQSMDD